MTALTALTAQNTVGVTAIQPVPPEFVRTQIDAVTSDIGVDAAKTGMLASAEIVETVAEAVRANGISKLVVDPVFISKHQNRLLASDAIDALIGSLLPLATVITPNLYEAGGLTGTSITSLEEMRAAGERLRDLGAAAVLVKGGHLENVATDLLLYEDECIELTGPRYETSDTHGTGCALSAAIAAHLARGDDLQDSIRAAKDFVAGAIRHGLRLGAGFGPVNPGWKGTGPNTS